MTIDINIVKRASGWLEPDACERLRAAAAAASADTAVLEIGAYRGKSTGWLALGSSEGNGAPVYTIDCWDLLPAESWPEGTPSYVQRYSDPGVERDYLDHLEALDAHGIVTPIKGFSQDVAKTWKKDGRPKVGVLFVDGSHLYDDVLADLRAWAPLLAPDAVIIMHDATATNCDVMRAAEDFFKTRQRRFDWQGREIVPWMKDGKDTGRRGTLTVRTK